VQRERCGPRAIVCEWGLAHLVAGQALGGPARSRQGAEIARIERRIPFREIDHANPGIAGEPKVTCIPIAADAIGELTAAAVSERADLVVCGPEVALCAGLGDAMRAAGLSFFGPSKGAAEIEGSKAFAKRLMSNAGVATAAFGVFDEVSAAEAFIDAQRGNVVIKADGLAAGKGVVVADDKAQAKAAVRRMLSEGAFGAAGARVVIE